MRINTASVQEAVSAQVKTGSGSDTLTLKAGDTLEARVIFSEKGNVNLKTSDGTLIRAKLESDMPLAPGDKVTLVATEKVGNTIFFALEKTDSQSFSARGTVALMAADKTLEAFAAKLSQLKLPVTDEAAAAMKEMLTLNPKMTMDEAAFLVSNKIPAGTPLAEAAKALITDGAKTDDMVREMLALLENSGKDAGSAAEPKNAPLTKWLNTVLDKFELQAETSGKPVAEGEAAAMNKAQTDTQVAASGKTPEGMEAAALGKTPADTEAAAQIKMSSVADPAALGKLPADAEATAQGKAQVNADAAALIKTPADTEATAQGKVQANAEAAALTKTPADTEAAAQGKAPVNADAAALTKTPADTEAAAQGKAQINADATALAKTPADAGATAQDKTPVNADAAALGKHPTDAEATAFGKASVNTDSAPEKTAFQNAKQAVTEFLRNMPEFSNTSEKILSEFSERLLNSAIQLKSAPKDAGTTEKLTTMLNGLFEKLPPASESEKGGETIRKARDELFMRLTLFEEALKSSDTPSKAALLKETETLMNHVKLQNSIDQFVYVQLPIKLGDENKTAELYVYKHRKGGKAIDPENASILLALDLEHIGHTESFVKVRGREVTLQTEVPSEEAKTFFTRNTRMLHEMLAGINYRLAALNVSCTEGETTPLNALVSLLEREKKPAAGIDYRI